jgi:hypothetical protein
VDHAAIAAGLVGVEDIFLLDVRDREMRKAFLEFPSGSQADDAAADDRDVVDHILPILSGEAAAR